jgi:hypothetical protein
VKRCPSCGDGRAAHVDHDQDSGAVRAILCFNCNRGLGYLGDDLPALYGIADYLEALLTELPLDPVDRELDEVGGGKQM